MLLQCGFCPYEVEFMKKFLHILLTVSIILSSFACEGVFASQHHFTLFLQDEYYVYKNGYDEDGASISDGNKIKKISADSGYEMCFSDASYTGKTRFGLDFYALGYANAQISLIGADISDITEKIELGKIKICSNENLKKLSVFYYNKNGAEQSSDCAFDENEWYGIDFEIDTNLKKFDVLVYKNIERTLYEYLVEDCPLDIKSETVGINGIRISAKGAEFNIDNLFAQRSRRAVENKVGAYADGKILTVCANNPKGEKPCTAYVVFYDENGVMKSAKTFTRKKFYDSYFERQFALESEKNGTYKVYVWENGILKPVAVKNTLLIDDGFDTDGAIFTENFEDDFVDNDLILSGNKLVNGWSFGRWGNSESAYDTGVTADEKSDGGYSVKIASVQKGRAGITKKIALPEKGFRLSFDIKTSENYSGNYPKILFLCYNAQNQFFSLAGEDMQMQVKNGEWVHNTINIDCRDFPEETAKVEIAFVTQYDNSGKTAQGFVYLDSIKADNYYFYTECDNKISADGAETPFAWYEKGSAVTYTVHSSSYKDMDYIEGIVYNSYGEEVARVKTDSADDGEKWSYTPDGAGFYSIVFFLSTKTGKRICEYTPMKMYYNSVSGKIDYLKWHRKDFYVTPHSRVNMADRNGFFGLSISPDTARYYYDIADKIGFSFLRLHEIDWRKAEPQNGTYDWSGLDGVFNYLKNSDDMMFDIIGNVVRTPKWASSNADSDKYYGYIPSDMTYFTDFMTDIINRYGGYVDTWEIYNEPHLPGGSVFWNDTAENYVKLLKAGYETAKSETNGNAGVIMGGIGARRYLSFYRRFIESGGYNYTDKLVMHGKDIDPWNYNAVTDKYGIEPKGVIDSESHMALLSTADGDIYFTEKESALNILKEYLKEIKYGVEKNAVFTLGSIASCEEIDYYKSYVTSAEQQFNILRGKPEVSPRFMTAVIHNLINFADKNTVYEDEYKLGDINIVRLKTGNDTSLILWADELKPFDCPESVKNLIGENTLVTDWEGRNANVSDIGKKSENVYFIKNADASKINFESAKNDKIYNGSVLYCDYEMKKSANESFTAKGTAGEIFDHSSGAEKQAEFVTEGWKNDGASFAVSRCTDGVDFIIKTENPDPYFAYYGDGITIGIDTFANGIRTDLSEFSLKTHGTEDNISCALIKTESPEIGGDLPGGYTQKGGKVVRCKLFVTHNGGVTTYKVHIDASELYPWYADNGTLAVSFKINNYDTNGNLVPQNYWGQGERYSVWEVYNFGRVVFE